MGLVYLCEYYQLHEVANYWRQVLSLHIPLAIVRQKIAADLTWTADRAAERVPEAAVRAEDR
jgi:hypothetical protein